MAEEQESKIGQSTATENEDNDGKTIVATHIPSPYAFSVILSEAQEIAINVFSLFLLPLYDVRKGRLS